jgi:hypothetical protein
VDGPRPPRPVVRSRADLGRRRACGARRAAADPRHGRDVAGQPAPDDLRATAAGVDFLAQPFVPLYRTDDEFAAELSNRNIHAVMHLAWAEQASGDYQGQMAVYVNPAAGSAPPKWPLSSPSVTSSSTRHSRATSNERGTAGFHGRRHSRLTTHDTPRGSSRCQTRLQLQHSSTRIARRPRRSVHPDRHRRSVGARALPRPRPRGCVRPRDPRP